MVQHHDINRIPSVDGNKPNKRFKSYPIGYFHIDIAGLRAEAGKPSMFMAIDRVTKVAFARLEQKANVRTTSAFLEALIEAIPDKIHTILTDNGVQFTFQPRHRDGPTARYATHMLDPRCREHGTSSIA